MKVIADGHDHHDNRSLSELFENTIKSNCITTVMGKSIINMVIIRLFIFLKLLFFIKLTNFTIYFTIKIFIFAVLVYFCSCILMVFLTLCFLINLFLMNYCYCYCSSLNKNEVLQKFFQ
jgi:hypothetical protein